MSKVLQENAGPTSGIGAPVRPTELILDRRFCEKAIEFVKDAKSEIRLCAYAWRWYPSEPGTGIQKFNIELKRAVFRGIKVRCLLNNYSMWKQFSDLGFDCRYVDRNRFLHTKAIVVDRKTLVLGSHNLTKRATGANFEASIAIQEFEPIEQFVEYFDKMWEACHKS